MDNKEPMIDSQSLACLQDDLFWEFESNHDGYKTANILEEVINAELSDNPITEKNVLAWLCFSRTLKTDLDLIYNECIEKLKELGIRTH